MDESSLIKWVLAAVAAIGATLATVIAYLFKAMESSNSKRIDQLEHDVSKCEEKHVECEQRYESALVKLNETAIQLTEVRVKLGMPK